MTGGVKVFPIEKDLQLFFEDPPYTIPDDKKEFVERIWREEKEKRGEFIYDAPLLFLTRHKRSSIQSRFIQYKDYIALKRRPDIFKNQEIFTLGVSGLLLSEDHLFWAKRAHHVTGYADYYEIVPSGGIDATFAGESGRVDFVAQLIQELKEEIGVQEKHIIEKNPFALIFDEGDRTYDICVECRLSLKPQRVIEIMRKSRQNEYVKAVAVKIGELEDFLADKNNKVVPTSLAMLEYKGFITQSLRGARS